MAELAGRLRRAAGRDRARSRSCSRSSPGRSSACTPKPLGLLDVRGYYAQLVALPRPRRGGALHDRRAPRAARRRGGAPRRCSRRSGAGSRRRARSGSTARDASRAGRGMLLAHDRHHDLHTLRVFLGPDGGGGNPLGVVLDGAARAARPAPGLRRRARLSPRPCSSSTARPASCGSTRRPSSCRWPGIRSSAPPGCSPRPARRSTRCDRPPARCRPGTRTA